jgi:hypothetical protein
MTSHNRFELAIDSTQISLFLECPKKWWWSFRQRLQRKGQKRDALDKGSLVHWMMDGYYHSIHRGAKWQVALKETQEALARKDWLFLGTKEEEMISLLERLPKNEVDLIKDRFNQYAVNYHMADFVPLTRNGKPAIEVGFSVPIVDNSFYLFVLEGRLDFIANYNGIPVNVDHKSQARKKARHAMEVQFLNYSLATGINRMCINYFGLQKDFKAGETFRRDVFCYNPIQLRIWRQKLETIFYRMAHAIQMDYFDTNEFSCSGGRGGWPCEFVEICKENVAPGVIQAKIKENYEERPLWTPWSDLE